MAVGGSAEHQERGGGSTKSRSEVPAGAGARRGTWRRRLAVGAVVFSGLCVLGVLGMLLTVLYGWQNPTESQKNCCWEQNATPEWTAETMGVQVPETATDRRAGLHSNVQYDAALLTFTVSTAEADRFLRPLLREGARMARNRHPEKQGYTRSDGFSHLGLPEPETFTEGMRIAGVCPRESNTPEGNALGLCVNIHAHEFQPGTTRVYLWAGSDAPLPKPPT